MIRRRAVGEEELRKRKGIGPADWAYIGLKLSGWDESGTNLIFT